MEKPSGMSIAFLSPGISFMQRIGLFIATAGGAGHSPVAPGTAGALVGLLLYVGLGQLNERLQAFIVLGVLAAGFWATGVLLRRYGTHDDSRIVIDEVVGLWITLYAMPVTPLWFAIGFILFRFLDILKPFPANWFDRKMPGSAGVLLDDVVCGIYGQALLRVLMRFTGAEGA